MTDRELLELIAAQVNNLTKEVDEIKNTMATNQDLTATKQELMVTKQELKQEIAEVKAIVVKIENDHGQKLGVLFDGYKLNSEKLDRIEAAVARHEDIIVKRLNSCS
ncbi:MAG: hypothetical protein GX263_00815 [Firmicutes bacterium]|nr:hypothetical protein [Bacillota bacterium]